MLKTRRLLANRVEAGRSPPDKKHSLFGLAVYIYRRLWEIYCKWASTMPAFWLLLGLALQVVATQTPSPPNSNSLWYTSPGTAENWSLTGLPIGHGYVAGACCPF